MTGEVLPQNHAAAPPGLVVMADSNSLQIQHHLLELRDMRASECSVSANFAATPAVRHNEKSR